MLRFRLFLPPPALRQRLLALAAGALLAAVATGGPHAEALLQPEAYGDPKNPARFQKRGPQLDSLTSQHAGAKFQPSSSAGNTGFDSGNNRKKKAKAKPGEKAKPQAFPTGHGVPPPNPYAAKGPVPRPATGVERKGASAYVVPPVPPVQGDATPRRRVVPEEAPFDPIGIQTGAFNFKPAVELTGGYDSNARRSTVAAPSWYSVVAPELKFESNWSRHSFTGELRGTYSAYRELPSLNRPAFDGKLVGRVDVTRDSRIDLEGKFLVGTDSPGSPNIQAGLAKLPIFTTWGGTFGLGHRFNRFDIAVKGGAERTDYQDSVFTDGSVASNKDRNYVRSLATLRAAYELTPGIKPFVEFGVDRRVHDLDVDAFGFRRNSDGRSAKAGSTFEITRILTGEVALGWLARRYADPTLPNLSGVSFDGSLTWLASALTTAKLTAATRADESRVPGVSSQFTREVALQVDHAFRRWLIATGKLTRARDDYVGSPRRDDRTAASAAVTYKLTRELHLKSELRREWQRSSVSGADYSANVILFGLRVQR